MAYHFAGRPSTQWFGWRRGVTGGGPAGKAGGDLNPSVSVAHGRLVAGGWVTHRPQKTPTN